jgi:hypothetical protein
MAAIFVLQETHRLKWVIKSDVFLKGITISDQGKITLKQSALSSSDRTFKFFVNGAHYYQKFGVFNDNFFAEKCHASIDDETVGTIELSEGTNPDDTTQIIPLFKLKILTTGAASTFINIQYNDFSIKTPLEIVDDITVAPTLNKIDVFDQYGHSISRFEFIKSGEVINFRAIAEYIQSGSSNNVNITSKIKYHIWDENVATLEKPGQIKVVGIGTTSIIMFFEDIIKKFDIIASDPDKTDYVRPKNELRVKKFLGNNDMTLDESDTGKMVSFTNYVNDEYTLNINAQLEDSDINDSNDIKLDIVSEITEYTITDTSIIQFEKPNKIKCLAVGTSIFSFKYGNRVTAIIFNIERKVESVSLVPNSVSNKVGDVQTFYAEVKYNDDSTENIYDFSPFVSDTYVATQGDGPYITALNPGKTKAFFDLNGQTAKTEIEVTKPASQTIDSSIFGNTTIRVYTQEETYYMTIDNKDASGSASKKIPIQLLYFFYKQNVLLPFKSTMDQLRTKYKIVLIENNLDKTLEVAFQNADTLSVLVKATVTDFTHVSFSEDKIHFGTLLPLISLLAQDPLYDIENKDNTFFAIYSPVDKNEQSIPNSIDIHL